MAGNPVTAAVTTWYLLNHVGDHVAFVSDTTMDWPFAAGSRSDLDHYADKTEDVVRQLIESGILRDEGIAWADFAEPQTVSVRALRNVWVDSPQESDSTRQAPPT